MQPCPDAAPYPVFGTLHKPRTHGVTLDIAAQSVEVLIAFHRKRLETALVHVPFTFTVMRLLPATNMGGHQLMHEGGQLIVQFRPQNESG